MSATVRHLVVAAAISLAAACSAASAGDSGTRPISRDVITAEEIEATPSVRTAFDAIQQLRPAWLRARGRGSIRGAEGIRVYVNGVPGSAGVLRSLDCTAVQEIRRLSAIEATRRFGTDHSQGAIVVRTR